MGKATAVTVVICGLMLFFIGVAFVFGMIAGNMPVIVAGPFLILAVLLMAMGVYVMSKGHNKWKKAHELVGISPKGERFYK